MSSSSLVDPDSDPLWSSLRYSTHLVVDLFPDKHTVCHSEEIASGYPPALSRPARVPHLYDSVFSKLLVFPRSWL